LRQETPPSRAIAVPNVFQYLPVAGRVAERGIRPAADHQVNALGLAGVVVVQEQLRFLGQERLAILGIAIRRPAGGPDHLFLHGTGA
jgi:hypothetical protein